ncbi:MAG: VWA domain-containing protein [Myxococcales bacterium]|nr:VWA domain-containing protein [Myxococcales bacterium]
MTRVVDELLWSLRRAGLAISTAQAIDAVRATALVGLTERQTLKDALFATLVTKRSDAALFERGFAEFFSGAPRRSLWERLDALGFSEAERLTLRELLDAHAGETDGALLMTLLGRGSDLSQLLLSATAGGALAPASPHHLGFATHKVLERMGEGRAQRRLALLRRSLVDALGERGEALADAVQSELDAVSADVREHFARSLEERAKERASPRPRLEDKALASLGAEEAREIRLAIRRFVERLRGGARVRRRRAARGRIDPHRTLRAALRTFGVPLKLARKTRRRDRPQLVILCDVSDSVRATSRFMLEFVSAAHELFSRTRSFVFVSDVAETTHLFETLPTARALEEACSGRVVPTTSNSHYGRALRAFEGLLGTSLDRKTTLVVLGDGRTNFQDAGADVVGRLKDRVRSLYWLCPEGKDEWAQSDSAMVRYEPHCTRVLEVRTARELEVAARTLVRGVG